MLAFYLRIQSFSLCCIIEAVMVLKLFLPTTQKVFTQPKTKKLLLVLLMLLQWSGREWGRWGIAVWSPQLSWTWRRCSSLRWSTFLKKHTPSTTLPPACVLLCPLGKSISSWAMRMRRGPGRGSMMWRRFLRDIRVCSWKHDCSWF